MSWIFIYYFYEKIFVLLKILVNNSIVVSLIQLNVYKITKQYLINFLFEYYFFSFNL